MAYISKMTLPNGETYQLKDKEARASIPIKLSELENDAGFLTQHQDISGKANVSDLETHTQDTDIHISAAERQKWNSPSDWNQDDTAAADFIKNKPQIPSKMSDLQNDVGYLTEHQDISGKADAASVYTKDQIDAKFSSVMNYKGTVMSVSGLPNSGNTLGDVYHVNADGSEWAWNGETWEELGKTIDISGKVDKVAGKDLSTNDFTDAYKTKLDNTAGNTEMTILDVLDAWNNV